VKKVIVYIEGPSDRLAMEELLADLLARLRTVGVAVKFIPTEGKGNLVRKTPVKAVNILRNDPYAIVIALPDLYPPNVSFAHATFDEMACGFRQEFERIMKHKQIDDVRLSERFCIFCFKHDLEALVLAAEDQLASRLGIPSVTCDWIKPVEDQDHHTPPKRVVERLFETHESRYQDTIDDPLILGASHYPEIAAACPQCFKPFVDYLESLLSGEA
jgi:hypothetical protein